MGWGDRPPLRVHTRMGVHLALARACAHTSICDCVIAEATRAQREREQYAPPQPERTAAEALEVLTRAMRRQEAEVLALRQVDRPDLAPTVPAELPRASLSELPEAAADRATTFMSPQTGPLIRGPVPTDYHEPPWRPRGRDRDTSRER
jgi:hypothetical protein